MSLSLSTRVAKLTVKPLLIAVGVLLLAVAALSAALAVQHYRHAAAMSALEQAAQARATAAAEAQVQAVQSARAEEQSQATAMAAIGATHEQDREAAQAVPAAVVADLRAGRLRLRDDLAQCHTQRLSDAVAAAGERDAPAELRAEVAGNLVLVGRDADDQLRACQSVVRQLTGEGAQ